MKHLRLLLLALALLAGVVGGSARLTANAHTTSAPQRLLACGEHLPPCW